jgi:TldD protein
MITLALALAFAADEAADPIAALDAAMEAELARTGELSLPDAPPVYLARTHALLLEHAEVTASFGGILSTSTDPIHRGYAEIRVGSPAFDNTGFGGWQTGFVSFGLPARITEQGARLGLWRAFDQSYKEAVEQHARKSAQFVPPPDHPGDYTLVTPIDARDVTAPPLDIPALEALATNLSAVLAEDFDGVRLVRGEAFVGAESGTHLIRDTSGLVVQRPVAENSLQVVMHARAADGMLLSDHCYYTARTTADLGEVTGLSAEVRERAAALAALTTAPALDEEYVGPVLFEDSAAADLFRFILVPQLEGTPSEVPFDSFLGELGSGATSDVRLGRRVLPVGWSVVDDPRADPTFPGSFAHDSEGTPSERVDLVEDGIVRTALMSRVPRSDIPATNGHARGGLSERARGRASQVTVTAPKAQSPRQIHRRAFSLARSYGHDHYVVVRRLQEPSARLRDEPFAWLSDEEAAMVPAPLAIVRVFADGREEVVRGARFTPVQRYALRDIAAVGSPHTLDYLASAGGSPADSGPTSGLPTRITAPAVLVGELEIIPAPGDPRDVPLLGRQP